MYRGLEAESRKASRSRFTAALILCSNSTTVLSGHRRLRNLLAQHRFAGTLYQHSEDLERLFLQSNPAPFFAQFARSDIESKRAKAHNRRCAGALLGVSSLSHPEIHAQNWGL